MKIGDKVYNERDGEVGFIKSEPYYRNADKCDDYILETWSSYMVLYIRVDYQYGKCDNSGKPILIESATPYEDVALADIPQLNEYMTVQVSMHSDRYWGMKGRVTDVWDGVAFVKLFGFRKPIKFKIGDLEPLQDGGLLGCWLDSF